MSLVDLKLPPTRGTLVWWQGPRIVTQTSLYEGETEEQAQYRAVEHFRLLNPGEWPHIAFCTRKFYPKGT